MRPMFYKGLQDLSAQELEQLLSYVGLDRFVANFKDLGVRPLFFVYTNRFETRCCAFDRLVARISKTYACKI